jgi:hypothetical protein
MIDQIGGWSSIGTIGSKYGQGYDLDAVREQLNKISLASARSQKATPMHLLERWDEEHRGATRGLYGLGALTFNSDSDSVL